MTVIRYLGRHRGWRRRSWAATPRIPRPPIVAHAPAVGVGGGVSESGGSGTSRRRWQGASARGEERGIDLGDGVHIKIEAQVECPAGVEI
jgi:hypothetical protein